MITRMAYCDQISKFDMSWDREKICHVVCCESSITCVELSSVIETHARGPGKYCVDIGVPDCGQIYLPSVSSALKYRLTICGSTCHPSTKVRRVIVSTEVSHIRG